MLFRVSRVAALAACGLGLAACQLDPPKPAAPVKKPPAPDYAMGLSLGAPPANLRAICFTDAEIAQIRARMAQQELSVGTLQCQLPGGGRALQSQYESFVDKFNSELATNARATTAALQRRRMNFNSVITEMANRTAQRAQTDPQFCDRKQRALEWGNSPQVASLTQVPPPYDLGPEMNIWACEPQKVQAN